MTLTAVRDQFVQAVRSYAADGKNSQPLGDLYQTTDGTQVVNSFRARPVVGGHLALVRLSLTGYHLRAAHVRLAVRSSRWRRLRKTLPALDLPARLAVLAARTLPSTQTG